MGAKKKIEEETEEVELAEEEFDEEIDDEDVSEFIELIDEDDKVYKFKILDVIKYKGAKYAFLLAAEPDEEFTENDVVIFRINEENETLEPIEDDIMDEVYNYYMDEIADGDDEEN